MFDFLDEEYVGKEYNGFVLLKVEDLPDYKAKGVFLRHKNTGLEIYHVVKDDKENLFGYAFRTLAKDSKGTAHIMEHSTLCSSEKYPLKEPFATLASTSMNTLLNAYTYPDKTIYPAASVVRDDYFTMFDVYTDCIFFPKLKYETFIQEGHRLELNENNELSIQGVVYNEMKGSYSSYTSIAYSNLIAAMFPESYPAYNSGGDPLEIPTLKYEEFLDFHQRFYNPDNCLLFLYGDIPTGEQLDFLNERFIPRIEKKYGIKPDTFDFNSKLPIVKPEIIELQKLKLQTKSQKVYSIAPETGSTGSFVSMNWYSGISNMEKYYISEVLFGNDSSPVSYELRESQLGDEISCGNFGQFYQEFFSVGLFGVKKENEQKVFDLIEKTIQEVYKNGIEQEDIDSAIMGIDFNLREINRYWGPQSFTIMEKVTKGWQNGLECSNQLTPFQSFEVVKENIKNDPEYTKKLIKKYFIDPEVTIKSVVEPSADYFSHRIEKEAQLISKLEKKLDKNQLKKDLDKLHEYQAYIETPEETKLIPSTKLSSLDPKIDFPKVELQFIKNNKNDDIPVFLSNEETNGLFYVDVLWPFDRIDPKYTKYLPFLSNVLTNMGWNGKSWDDCITESACIMGDVWGRVCCGEIPNVPDHIKILKKYEKFNFEGRNWLGVSCKGLTDKVNESLNLLAEIITTMSFDDSTRFNTIAQENVAEKKLSIVQTGREYAIKRAKADTTINNAISEIMWGVTQLYTVKEYVDEPAEKTLKIFKQIYEDCLESGGIIHITADDDSLKKIIPLLQSFINNAKIKKLLPAKNYTIDDYLPYISQNELVKGDNTEQIIEVESQTGYAVGISTASEAMTVESFAEIVLTNWLGMHSLWDKIRTTGGAYGANSWADSNSKTLVFSSYRDPNPEKSIQTFLEVLKEVSENPIPKEDIEKTIVASYGDAIVPQCPRDRGNRSFENLLYAIEPELRQKRIDLLLKITPEDISKAAERLYKNTLKVYKTAIFRNISENSTSKIVNLPL